MTDRYQSPLATRYAGDYMVRLFSSDTRYSTWRKLWVSLAKAEMELGLPVAESRIEQMSEHIYDIDYDVVREREKQVRHDVMAHIYAFGQVAPKAKGIIHLGATSCYVTDNRDLIIYRDGVKHLKEELKKTIKNLWTFADKYKSTATLGYTHYQPAQPVTVGKRATLWMQDFVGDLEEIDFVIDKIKFLGSRGTVGTEASFMELFGGDREKIKEMNLKIAGDFGFESCFDVCGQTYPRKLDTRILNVLSSIAQSACKMATDIRLLQHDRQIEEPFEKDQIGSSAMAYKRNPMRCERICSLSRYLMSLSRNGAMTASSQWLERTLDDSAERRISMPEAFLCADGILRLCQNVTSNLVVNENIIEQNLYSYIPFIATENLLMEGVKRGGDRQQLHEIIRKCSMEVNDEIKNGKTSNLIEKLKSSGGFMLSDEEFNNILNPDMYIGRSAEQVSEYLEKIKPMIENVMNTNTQIEI